MQLNRTHLDVHIEPSAPRPWSTSNIAATVFGILATNVNVYSSYTFCFTVHNVTNKQLFELFNWVIDWWNWFLSTIFRLDISPQHALNFKYAPIRYSYVTRCKYLNSIVTKRMLKQLVINSPYDFIQVSESVSKSTHLVFFDVVSLLIIILVNETIDIKSECAYGHEGIPKQIISAPIARKIQLLRTTKSAFKITKRYSFLKLMLSLLARPRTDLCLLLHVPH